MKLSLRLFSAASFFFHFHADIFDYGHYASRRQLAVPLFIELMPAAASSPFFTFVFRFLRWPVFLFSPPRRRLRRFIAFRCRDASFQLSFRFHYATPIRQLRFSQRLMMSFSLF